MRRPGSLAQGIAGVDWDFNAYGGLYYPVLTDKEVGRRSGAARHAAASRHACAHERMVEAGARAALMRAQGRMRAQG